MIFHPILIPESIPHNLSVATFRSSLLRRKMLIRCSYYILIEGSVFSLLVHRYSVFNCLNDRIYILINFLIVKRNFNLVNLDLKLPFFLPFIKAIGPIVWGYTFSQ